MLMKYDGIKALIHTHHPSVPVYPERLDLANLVSTDGITNHHTILRFSRTILWERHLETTWRLMKRNVVVDEMSGNWCDGTFGLSLGHALRSAWGKVSELAILPSDALRVELLLRVTDVPTLDLTAENGLDAFASIHEEQPQSLSIPASTWLHDTVALEACLHSLGLPMAERLAMDWPWLKATHPIETGVVWTSDQANPISIENGDAWIAQWVAALTPREVAGSDTLFWRQA